MQFPIFTDGSTIKGDGTEEHPLASSGSVPGGANTDVQFNDAGTLNGVAAFTFDKATGSLIVNPVGGSAPNADILLEAGTHLSNGIQVSGNGVGNGVGLTAGETGGTAGIEGDAGIILDLITSGSILLQSATPTTIVEVTFDNKLGFFGVAPIVRHATPVTLADVIALLQAYGLSL